MRTGADGCGWVRMGCAGRGMEGRGCAARPERNADGARGADEVCGERVQIGRRAKRGAGFGRPRRGGKGDEKWAYSLGYIRFREGEAGISCFLLGEEVDTGGHLRTHVRIW